jgi:hypothetical protein
VRLKVVTEKALQAAGAAGCGGIRLISVYQVSGVRHLRKARGGLGSDWQLLSSGTSLPLGAGAVVVLKNRPAAARASRDAVCPSAAPNTFRSFRLFYVLEIRP